ncbi:MAG TPA: autotransporter domain-containing protein [Alphaproteobacteria bacterium]
MLTAASPARVQADEFIDPGDLPGGSFFAIAKGVSADGTVVVGDSGGVNGTEAFRWTQTGGMIGLGDLPGGIFQSRANGVSADGSVVVGYSLSGNGTEAFRWTQGTGMVGLGDLAGGSFESQALGVNADGSVIVGYGTSASGKEAFRWTQGTGMVGLGHLPGGGSDSRANGVSADGSVVVGYSDSASGQEAFRWTQGTGMVGLGDLPGGSFGSVANAVSADGSVVVGQGNSAAGPEAFRWTQADGIVGLGDLPGGGFGSTALATSADGSVVVGYGTGTIGTEAFLWTQADGMKSLAEILTANGVDLTGWNLQRAEGVSADGSVVVGLAIKGGDSLAFIATLGSNSGVTTPEDLAASLNAGTVPARQSQQVVMTALDRSLFAATHTVPAAPAPQLAAADPNDGPSLSIPSRWSAYAVGSIGTNDDDWSLGGTLGLMTEVAPGLRLGAGVIGDYGDADTYRGGRSRVYAAGGSVIAAYERPEGLRLYGTAFAAHLSADTDRHYQNGAGIDGSHGETDGIGYGAAVRGGWTFAVDQDTSVMPYAELRWSKTELDGYTETDGAFPATYSDQESTRTTSYLGIQVDYRVTPDLQVQPRLAWGHRLSGDDGTLTATTTGLTQTLSPVRDDRNWAEGAVAAAWQISNRTMLSAELAGRTGDTAEPEASLMVGLSMRL